MATPPQDYDDLYAIAYAKAHGGFVVTNAIFRDCIARESKTKHLSQADRATLPTRYKEMMVSFTFVDGEFMPYPGAYIFS